MGKSTVPARLVAVCAVTALTGGVLAVAPANAGTSGGTAPSVVTPAAVREDGVTPRGDVVWTCLRIKIIGVTVGGRATVKVTGPKQSKRKKAKKYSTVINQMTTLRVRPGVYRVTSAPVSATGGADVPRVVTKTLRVRKNRCTGFTVRYQFVASTPVATCAPGGGAANTCVVGDTGPGGGKVFYVNETASTGSRYMEAVSPSTTPAWQSGGVDPSLSWGVPSAVLGQCGQLSISTDTAIGTGKANTNQITVTPACDTPTKAPAAWAAKNYTGGGVSWFLPSKDELNELYTQQTVVGGFIPPFDFEYWSSSQNSPGSAWIQSFNNGEQGTGSRDSPFHVRPVRAF